MAFVPGLKHDLFLSYAHEDLAWVNELSEHLRERLQDKLACAVIPLKQANPRLWAKIQGAKAEAAQGERRS